MLRFNMPKSSKSLSRRRVAASRSAMPTLILRALTVSFLCIAAGSSPHPIRSGETWKSAETIDAPGVDGVLFLAGNINGVQIGPAKITRAYRAIESAQTNANLSDIRIENFVATDLERDGIRLRGNVDRIVIRNFVLSMRDQPQQASHLPEGIALMSGRNIDISDGKITGFRLAAVQDKYPNGDGIAAERGVSGLRIERVEANDNADGGFDLKSSDTHLDHLSASRNFRNYRFWGDIQAGTLASVDPTNAHIWAGPGASVRIQLLVARSVTTAPLVSVEKAREIEIDRCDLQIPATAPILAGDVTGVRVTLGPGCERK